MLLMVICLLKNVIQVISVTSITTLWSMCHSGYLSYFYTRNACPQIGFFYKISVFIFLFFYLA